MDVGGWLRGLGLDQYERNFRDNKVDADALLQLTADDLREIGVSAVGDRRRLLAAIAALAPAPVTQGEGSDSPSRAERGKDQAPRRGGGASPAHDFAERRPITIMFCDLVGSTSLASRLDAEDWRNLVSAYLDAAEAAVTAFGGHVQKRLGDGLMALFSYPQAQENDAERAVRAALAIQRALSPRSTPGTPASNGVFLEGLAKVQNDASGAGTENMRRGVELLREQNVLLYNGLVKIVLAEAEARTGDVDRAVDVLDEALATSERMGHRTFDAELHRVRGEMLLKRDPANPAAAEEALQTAIAVAKRQATRSFELRASLSLAKLYHSTGRPVEAHAVLAPALEGFAPTPEMPEIAKAQVLLGHLAKAASAPKR